MIRLPLTVKELDMSKPIPDKEKDFELIGRFHDFALSEEELAAFEQRLENDPDFQERFRLYREMEETITQTFPSEVQQEVKMTFKANTRDNDPPKKEAKVRSLFSRPLVQLAAAVALLLVVGLWWILQGPSLQSPQTLATYYWDHTDKTHLLESAQRGEGDPDGYEPARNFFRTLQNLYDNGQYNLVIDQLEIYKQTTPEPVPFLDDADWLLALAFLANGDTERARTQLELIEEQYPAREERVRELLGHIEEMEGG